MTEFSSTKYNIESFLEQSLISLLEISQFDQSYDLTLDLLQTLIFFTNRPTRCQFLLTSKYENYLCKSLSHYESKIQQASIKVLRQFYANLNQGSLLEVLETTESLDILLNQLINFSENNPKTVILEALLAIILRAEEDVLYFFAFSKGGIIVLQEYLQHQLKQFNGPDLEKGINVAKTFFEHFHNPELSEHIIFKALLQILQMPQFRLNVSLINEVFQFLEILLQQAHLNHQAQFVDALRDADIDIEEGVLFWMQSANNQISSIAGRVAVMLSKLAVVYLGKNENEEEQSRSDDIDL